MPISSQVPIDAVLKCIDIAGNDKIACLHITTDKDFKSGPFDVLELEFNEEHYIEYGVVNCIASIFTRAGADLISIILCPSQCHCIALKKIQQNLVNAGKLMCGTLVGYNDNFI